MSQQFCLKWNNHTTNMLQVFENLLTTEALVDVTLACDGLSLKAHKMVLSACSPFFQSLFLENPCKHPIVIMKDMRYCDLKAIIDFMYRGEVNVSHDQLSALLKTAETLKVKGLAEVTGENRQASGIVQHEIIQQNASTPTPVPPSAQRTDTPPLQGKRKRGRPRKRSLSDSNRSDDEGVPPKIKETNSDIEELSGDASMEATSDNRSSGGPISCNSQSQVPIHSSNNVNTFSKSHLSTSHDPQGEEPASGDENEFEVEPSKLLEQTLTTENVPSNSHNSTGPITLPSVSGLEISRRSMSSTDSGSQALVPVSIPSDSLGSNVQGPDSPQDVKPQILSFDDPPISPVAGTSHGSDRSLMMYMDQSGVASIPGPSNFQDNSALVPHDSQPQVAIKTFLGRKKRINQDPISDVPFKNLESGLELFTNLDDTIKEECNSNEADVLMAASEENWSRSDKSKVAIKTYLGRKKKINQKPTSDVPFKNLESSLEPLTNLDDTIKEDCISNEADMPMVASEENGTESDKNKVTRKMNLVEEKRTFLNAFENQEPNFSLGKSLETITNVKETVKVSLGHSTSLEAITNVEETVKVSLGHSTSLEAIKNVEETVKVSLRHCTNLEAITNVEETVKEENDSNEANVLMAETERKETRSSKIEAKKKLKNAGRKRKNIDAIVNVKHSSKLRSRQTLVKDTSLELTPKEKDKDVLSEMEKCMAVDNCLSKDLSSKDEAKSDNNGEHAGKKKSPNCKDKVKRTKNLRENLSLIGNQEPNLSLRPSTSLDTMANLKEIVKEVNDSNEANGLMTDTGKKESRSCKIEAKKKLNQGSRKRKNLDATVKQSAKQQSRQMTSHKATSVELTPSVEVEIKEEDFLSEMDIRMAVEKVFSKDLSNEDEVVSGNNKEHAGKKESLSYKGEVMRKRYTGKKRLSLHPNLNIKPVTSLSSDIDSNVPSTSGFSNIKLISWEPVIKEKKKLSLTTSMNKTQKSEAHNSKNAVGSKDEGQSGKSESQNGKKEVRYFNSGRYYYSRYVYYTNIRSSLLKYKCESCDYAASNASSLKTHMSLHDDDYLFVCPYCDYKGRKHAYMKRHIVTKHRGESNYNTSRKPDPDFYQI